MRPAEVIKRAVVTGAMGNNEADTELLLDLREILEGMRRQAVQTNMHLAHLVANTPLRKGRPRKKAAGD